MSSFRLDDMIAPFAAPLTRDQAWSQACAVFAAAGFDGVFYADLGPHGGTVMRSARVDWGEDMPPRRGQGRDPLFDHACRSLQSSLTGPDFLHLHPDLDENARAFIHEASGSGFTAGLALPFRTLGPSGVGVWHLMSSAGGAHVGATAAQAEPALRRFCATVRAAMMRGPSEASEVPPVLSPRERECLLWLARGLRTDAIADRLGVSTATVHFHILNARRKFSADTREEALAKALVRGEIDL